MTLSMTAWPTPTPAHATAVSIALEKVMKEHGHELRWQGDHESMRTKAHAAVRRALAKVWQPHWDALASDLAATATKLGAKGSVIYSSQEVDAYRYISLYAMRERLFPAMQDAVRSWPYFNEHHDWASRAKDIALAAVDSPDKGRFPTIQAVDPFAAFYLPSTKTAISGGVLAIDHDGVGPFRLTKRSKVHVGYGVVVPVKGITGAGRRGAAAVPHRVDLYVLVRSWSFKPIVVDDPQYERDSNVAAMQEWAGMLSYGDREHGPFTGAYDRVPVHVKVTERDKVYDGGILLYAGNYPLYGVSQPKVPRGADVGGGKLHALSGKKLDAEVDRLFNKHGVEGGANVVGSPQFDIVNLGKIAEDIKVAILAGEDGDEAAQIAVSKYRTDR